MASIARSWHARASVDGARAYVAFFERVLVPQLKAIEGHRGALVMTRPGAGSVELHVLTLWASREAIARFAGAATLDVAVVEPEARAVLQSFDDRVVHFDVPIDTLG